MDKILSNIELVKEWLSKQSIKEKPKSTVDFIYTGRAFILQNKKTKDCKRYNSTAELLKEFGYDTTHGRSLWRALKTERIRKVYKFFAYEDDLLSWAEDL